MNKLQSKLQAKIQARPLRTYLRDDHPSFDDQHILKISDIKRKWIKVPEEFDGRIAWKGLLTPVENQGTCGSCWKL